MPKFVIDRQTFMNALLPPTSAYIESVVRENNSDGVVIYDPSTDTYTLKCENKPRDLPMFGVFWEEVKE